MLVLLLAELQSTHWLGPVLAVGVATMLLAAFTLLPALLALLGERAFWPARPASAVPLPAIARQGNSGAGAMRAHEPDRRWAAVAGLVRRRPRSIVVTVLALLLVLALGNLSHHGTIGFGQGEIGPTESSRGNEVLGEHFPPGLGSPLTAVVHVDEVEPALGGLKQLDEVKLTVPVPPSPGSDKAVLTIVLRGDPYSGAATEAVETIRDKLDAVAPSALLGGIPAENLDVEQANARDTGLIVPLVLLVVAPDPDRGPARPGRPGLPDRHRGRLLRGDARPRHLRLLDLVGSGGIAFNLVLIAFIFLVALGVDYNIFLMARAREEARRHGTREGVLVALREHRRRRHRRRPGPRRHLRDADAAAAGRAGADRRRGRRRRPARHLRRAGAADPGDHLPAWRARLVARRAQLNV